MSCRHYCIEFLKKSFSKTFLFFKIIYKYFAGFLAYYYADCHASLRSARNDMENKNCNDAIICSHYEDEVRDEVGQTPSNLLFGLLHYIRNDGICRNDAMVYIQFDKFQSLFSVIYKKIYY